MSTANLSSASATINSQNPANTISSSGSIAESRSQSGFVPPISIPALSDLNLPLQYSNKYTCLSEVLKSLNGEISANSKDELVLDGSPIPNSNFHDLIRALYVRNQNMNLNGLTNLYQKFHDINLDPNFVSNKEAISMLQGNSKRQNKTGTSSFQRGNGIKRESVTPLFLNKSIPPGKKPRILRIFR